MRARIVDTMRARTAKADEARTEAVHHARADQVVAAATTAVTVNREAVEAGRLPGAVDAPGVRRLVRCFWGGCCRLGNKPCGRFPAGPGSLAARPDHQPSLLRDLFFVCCDYAGLFDSDSSTHHLPLTLIFSAFRTSEIVEDSSNGNTSNCVPGGIGPPCSARCPCGQPSCQTRSSPEGSLRRGADMSAASSGDLTQYLLTGSVSL